MAHRKPATAGRKGSQMLTQIKGLHHVTSMAADARTNNQFFTDALGLRRVKKTVNFDSPDVYHLYYGDETGAPGTVMTYFPFPDMAPRPSGHRRSRHDGVFRSRRLARFLERSAFQARCHGLKAEETFGEKRLNFAGPDGDGFALVEVEDDNRPVWTANGVSRRSCDPRLPLRRHASSRRRGDGRTAEVHGL